MLHLPTTCFPSSFTHLTSRPSTSICRAYSTLPERARQMAVAVRLGLETSGATGQQPPPQDPRLLESIGIPCRRLTTTRCRVHAHADRNVRYQPACRLNGTSSRTGSTMPCRRPYCTRRRDARPACKDAVLRYVYALLCCPATLEKATARRRTRRSPAYLCPSHKKRGSRDRETVIDGLNQCIGRMEFG